MPGNEYAAVPSSGKLKLKGISDGRVDKKKKKKKKKKSKPEESSAAEAGFKDNSVVLKSLEDEDRAIAKDGADEDEGTEKTTTAVGEDEVDIAAHLQTEAERRFEEQRRKRLEERLKREGVKTHKQRVEDLNRYLSSLSEHNDMPKIGPG